MSFENEPNIISTGQGLVEKVLCYYQAIDKFAPEEGRNNIEEVMALFDPIACYTRGATEPIIPYQGFSAIEEFFRDKRRIRGRHILRTIKEPLASIEVDGRFKGILLADDGSSMPIEEDFWDLFLFGQSRLVVFRLSIFRPGIQI